MREGDEPPYYPKMRIIGYPPGYIGTFAIKFIFIMLFIYLFFSFFEILSFRLQDTNHGRKYDSRYEFSLIVDSYKLMSIPQRMKFISKEIPKMAFPSS